MKQKSIATIPLKGITRNTSFLTSEDGEMSEAVNIRYKHGKASHVREYANEDWINGLDVLYIHKTSEYTNAIYYQSNYIKFKDTTGFTGNIVSVGAVKPTVTIKHTGNILLILIGSMVQGFRYVKGENYKKVQIPQKLDFSAWAEDIIGTPPDGESAYQVFGSFHPLKQDTEKAHFSGDTSSFGSYGVVGVYSENTTSVVINTSESTWGNNVVAAVNKLTDGIVEEGNFYNPTLVSAAIRLFDGTLVAQTNPVLLASSAGLNSVMVNYVYAEAKSAALLTNNTLLISALPYRIVCKVDLSTLDLTEDLIEGVVIYVAEIPIYDATEKFEGDWVIGSEAMFDDKDLRTATFIERYSSSGKALNITDKPFMCKLPFEFDKESFLNRLKGVSVLYEVNAYDLDVIPTGQFYPCQGKDMRNIEVNNRLVFGESYALNLYEGVQDIFTYNASLYISGGSRTIIPPDISSFFYPDNGIPHIAFSSNHLIKDGFVSKYGDALQYVIHECVEAIYFDNGRVLKSTKKGLNQQISGVSPFIAINEVGVSAIKLGYKLLDINGSYTYYKKELDFTNSDIANLSIYVNEEFVPTLDKCSEDEYNNIVAIQENEASELSQEVLRVSDINNPFVIKTANTYTFSDVIIGICSAALPISTGQFGEYPLYIFCGDGIWSLSTGTGDIRHPSKSMVSFDICNNADSITPIGGGGVVFSTEKGLNLIQGQQVSLISEPLDGESIDINVDYKIEYDTAISDGIPFATYLSGADITYNYKEDELFVFNKEYDYYYCFHEGTWSKRTGRIYRAVTNNPSVYLLSDEDSYAWCNVINETGNVKPMVIVTRPCKFGSMYHKRAFTTILRGMSDKCRFDFRLLGSNDGKHFAVANITTLSAYNKADVHLGSTIRPYKYYAYAVMVTPIDMEKASFAFNQFDTAYTTEHTGRLR